MQFVSGLPSDLDAAVGVALHVPEESPSALPAILSRKGPLEAVHATDGEALLHGRIYVAPPGRHLLIKRNSVRAVNGPNENGHRPAVDPLFRSAARAHGLEENAALLRSMALRALDRGQDRSSQRYESKARGIEGRANFIREVLIAAHPEGA